MSDWDDEPIMSADQTEELYRSLKAPASGPGETPILSADREQLQHALLVVIAERDAALAALAVAEAERDEARAEVGHCRICEVREHIGNEGGCATCGQIGTIGEWWDQGFNDALGILVSESTAKWGIPVQLVKGDLRTTFARIMALVRQPADLVKSAREQGRREVRERAERAEQERDALRTAVEAFLAKHDAVQPAVVGAFQMAAIHGMPYTGPNYAEESIALRAILASRAAGSQGET